VSNDRHHEMVVARFPEGEFGRSSNTVSNVPPPKPVPAPAQAESTPTGGEAAKITPPPAYSD
jgi:hypothetical protein